ncbi:MAG: thioredoxin domain-containing protein [Candidatus Mycalebacterium zealandia]|nr:MAG: thioredoxin domain-containing protein [Candidatus Mycalebacterium zealandia]
MKIFLFSVFLCLTVLSCGGQSDEDLREKADAAAQFFAGTFSLFIPDGYTVRAENVRDKGDGFTGGVFVVKSPDGYEANIPAVPFLLTPDGRRIVLEAHGPFDEDDLNDSQVPGFKVAPQSFTGAPLLLVSSDGRVIAGNRILDTAVDYAAENMKKISLDETAVLGDPGAPVVIVEFSDFQCSYCRNSSGVLKKILDEYNGYVKVVYKQFPLDFHNWAYEAAEASYCFMRLGGNEAFGFFHDEVFAAQGEITKDNHKGLFAALAVKAGLNAGKFAQCVEQSETADLVERDVAEAFSLQVDGTPAFFVDGLRVPNDPGLLRKAIEMRLSRIK